MDTIPRQGVPARAPEDVTALLARTRALLADAEAFLRETDRKLETAEQALARAEGADRQRQAALDGEIFRAVEAMDAAARAYAQQLGT